MSFSFQAAFDARSDLKKYKEDALALFALQLRFQIEDIDIVATNSLTGKLTGGDDKKCDLIYVDKDRRCIVVIQTYIAQNSNKLAAKSNKASDLNTAATWLLNSLIDKLPDGLQSAAEEVRSTLKDGDVESVQFWYVHNLPESENVKAELQMVEQTASSSLKVRFPNSEIGSIIAIEVGQETLDEWYRALEAPILITEKFNIPISGGYTIADNDWESFVTAVPVTWLCNIFREYRQKLFSANVRGYLGSKASSSNINNGIKETAKNDPSHFWVYNNGITALVSDFQEKDIECSEHIGSKAKQLEITGISIVNGAQTTGAIGNLIELSNDTAKVQIRFVKCSNSKTIRNIIEYNNKQNVVEVSDFRSNDPIQRRLRQEFERIPDSTYYGGRRGGHEDIIRRSPNLLPSDTVAQALAAFHQEPVMAYNNKSDIWAIDTIYSKYFSAQTSAEHIVFAYSLLRSIEAKKRRLVNKDRSSLLSEAERKQLDFFQRRGPHLLLTAAIAKCLDTFLGKPIPNPFRVSFGSYVSPQQAEEIWEPVVEATVPFCRHLLPAVKKSLNNEDEAKEVIDNFKDVVESVKDNHTSRFEKFTEYVQICL